MPKYLVQHRRGTAEQWAEQGTLIPREGEIVIEIDEVNSLHKLKIGDGVHTYAELAYLQAGDEIVTQVLAEAKPRVITVELSGSWAQDSDDKYYQTLTLEGITAHSRLDLQPSVDMLAEFKQLGLVFVTENNSGVITVYSVGNMPQKAYTMQATIVETECDGEDACIIGTPIGTPVAQSNWSQTDNTKADFIKNKPTLGDLAAKDEVAKTDLAADVQTSLGKADSAIQSIDGLATEDYVDNKVGTLGSLASKSIVEKTDLSTDVQASLNKANTALQSFTEVDPTVPAWAKAASKPAYTASEVGALPLAGGTMAGALELAADPTTNMQASTKQYVDKEIDNIHIGGRNLFRNTKTFEGWILAANITAQDSVITWAATSTLGWNAITNRDAAVKYSDIRDKEVTISFEIRCDEYEALNSEPNHGLIMNLALFKPSVGSRHKYADANYFGYMLSDKWERIEYTFVASDSFFSLGTTGEIDPGIDNFVIGLYNYSLYSMQIRNVKLEKGNKTTDWTLAPEDVALISDLAAIPTPDVSGQINTHNSDTSAHNDIRTAIDSLSTEIANLKASIVTVHSGTEAPLNSLGEDGDLYLYTGV